MSGMCPCTKCIHSLFLIATLPFHPLTGKSCSPAAFRKEILYVCGSPLGGFPMISQANAMLCLLEGRKRTHRQVQSTVWELHL